jgi:hypothetical protein
VRREAELEREDAIDERLRRIARAVGAAESRFSALMARDVLERAEYPRAFPHLLMLAARVADPDAVLSGTQGLGEQAPTEWCLSPAVCYHVYASLAGRTLDRPVLVSTRGPCFRHEADCAPYLRQLEFSMREFVLVGSPVWVRSTARVIRRRVEALAIELGLRGNWRPASDPFFAPAAGKAAMQRLLNVKREYCSDERGGLALASVNQHRAFFSERFSIRFASGEPVHSACIAVGLDRWLGLLRHAPEKVPEQDLEVPA